jgi:hypothetical protein
MYNSLVSRPPALEWPRHVAFDAEGLRGLTVSGALGRCKLRHCQARQPRLAGRPSHCPIPHSTGS